MSGHMPVMASQSSTRAKSDESWVEIASQPSSSSLSSAAEDIVTTGLRVQHSIRANKRRRRTLQPSLPPTLLHNNSTSSDAAQGTSSQEEYEESESESDRVMTSSNEAFHPPLLKSASSIPQSSASDDSPHVPESDDDENRTAVNHPLRTENCFTPQPNAFSHPPTAQLRSASQPMPGSYFPTVTRVNAPSSTRRNSERPSHTPRNILSPSYNAAAHHDEALRSSLSTLLSCAAAARGLKPDSKTAQFTTPQPRSNRIEPMTLRLVPESALPASSPTFDLQEPVFRPTLRRASVATTTTISTSPERDLEVKRKTRPSSKERRAIKKQRRAAGSEELFLSPTLLTWVVSAGVVVVLSALSFTAGYSLGREAGRLEAGGIDLSPGDTMVRDCAREASRSSLGLKRSLARSAVQV